MKCITCEQEFESSKRQQRDLRIGKTKIIFCSKSCAATYNNIHYPKRKPEGNCKECGCAVATAYTYCNPCGRKYGWVQRINGEQTTNDRTIEECVKRIGSNRYDLVRSHARRKYRRYLETKPSCERCTYNKHLEICHVTPIADFPKETKLEEVNKRENIMFLCCNCHWEFDNL